MQKNKIKRLVVKVGTHVLTGGDGCLNLDSIEDIKDQVLEIRKQGIEVILVSSGAVGAGRCLINNIKNTDPIYKRQVLASVGQVELMNVYRKIFFKNDCLVGQILASRDDFRDREHYLNIRNCLEALLKEKIIPIINENDSVSVDKIMFTDNDELAGLVASMIGADILVILTDVMGIYDRDPKDAEAKVIRKIDPADSEIIKEIEKRSASRSTCGRGGIISKINTAFKAANLGITVYVASGKIKTALIDILDGKKMGTKIIAQKSTSQVKRWLAHSSWDQSKSSIYINEGAVETLQNEKKASSLLPVGIEKIKGDFLKGELIRIFSYKDQKLVGVGIAQYDSKTAAKILGKKGQKPLIHYDYLYLV
jgi:glutamate 5-kinase